MQNITPTNITTLKENEVFVFGSNMQGAHLGGAARAAVINFGAIMGQPIGMQGQSYAIPTLEIPAHSGQLIKLDLDYIAERVNEFIEFAKANPKLFFYVTPIGCGIAGFSIEEITPLFKDALEQPNIALPQVFMNYFAK